MEGWVGLVGWPISDTLSTKWSHVNHRSCIDQVKSASHVLTTEPHRRVFNFRFYFNFDCFFRSVLFTQHLLICCNRRFKLFFLRVITHSVVSYVLIAIVSRISSHRSMLSLVRIPIIAIMCVFLMGGSGAIGFIDTTLSIHLEHHVNINIILAFQLFDCLTPFYGEQKLYEVELQQWC